MNTRRPALLFVKLLLILIVIYAFPKLVIFNTPLMKIAYASATRGDAGDNWADIILGKPDFTEINPFSTVSTRYFLPHGVFVDRTNPSNNKIYVYDSGNNRILGYDLENCRASVTDPYNCEPDIVIGQPDFTTSACNADSSFQNFPEHSQPTASTLCGVPDSALSVGEGGSGSSMDVDSSGNLYITDNENNRVLKYINPFTTDSIADEVWGQNDFTHKECNKGNGESGADATSLCFDWGNSNNWTASVDIDSHGNLWIVDNGNNRVLRFPNEEGTISKTADMVIGQGDFTSEGNGSGLNQFHDPSVARVTDDDVMFVADRYNNRVLKFSTLETGATGEVFGSGFDGPTGIDFDDTEPGRIWITNTGHVVVELWDITSETKISTIGTYDDGNVLGDITGSVGVDSDGNVYVTTGIGAYSTNVLVFDKGEDPLFFDHKFVESRENYADEYGLGSGRGVAISNGQLIVADAGRILFWDIPSGISDLTTGKPADGWVSTDNVTNFNETDGACCTYLKTDEAGHLYTTLEISGDVLPHIAVYDLPLTTGESPSHIIEFPIDLLGGGQMTTDSVYNGFSGILPAPDSSYLWASIPTDNKVVRIRNPLTAPEVDVILGQPDATSKQCNQGGSMTNTTLCNSGWLSFDRNGNFYISDHGLENSGNARMIIYAADTFPTDNTEVIYETEPTKIITNIAPWEPAFDSNNTMVVGFNPYYNLSLNPDGGWFPGVFLDPFGSDTQPTFYLNDYFSMGFGATFDSSDNLYMTDLDRDRVLIYLAPFNDSVAPVITEVERVTTPTVNTQPSFVFNSTEAGDLSSGGSCSTSTTSAVAGDNTITIDELSPGDYSDCTFTVTDPFGNVSNTLTLTAFTIIEDNDSPTVTEVYPIDPPTGDPTPNYTFNSTEPGIITYGGSCSSSGLSPASIKIYVDGVRVDSNDVSGGEFTGPYSGLVPIEIGSQNSGSNAWTGIIDNVKIYSYGRNEQQIENDYNDMYDTFSSIPRHHWKFNEGTGTTTEDSGDLEDDGTLVGGPSWESGADCHQGNCLSFSGGSRVFPAVRQGPQEGITVEAWVNPSDTTGADLILSQYDGSNAYMQFYTVDSNIYFVIHQDIDTVYIGRVAEGVLTSGSLHHIAAVWDGGNTAYSGNNFITLDPLSSGDYSDCTLTVTDANGNESAPLTMSTFTILDTTDPILAEVTPVSTPTTDPTPSYTFSSSEDGTASYGGSCTSSDTIISSGNNTITFNTLTPGTYSDCTVTVTDADTNASDPLSITSFTIEEAGTDSTPPTIPGKPEAEDSPTDDNTPKWTWTASTDDEGLDYYQVQWCKDIDFDGCDSNVSNPTSNSFTHSNGLSDGSWYLRVRAIDINDNVSDWSISGRVKVDTEDPEIKDVDSDPSKTSIKVSWKTNEETNEEVEWGKTDSYGKSKEESDRTKEHSVTLDNLDPNTKYYIKIHAKDEAGNRSTKEITVTTDSEGNTTPVITSTTEPTTTTETPANPPTTEPVAQPETQTPNSETDENNFENNKEQTIKLDSENEEPKTVFENIADGIGSVLNSETVKNIKENVQTVTEQPASKAAIVTAAVVPAIPAASAGLMSLFSILPYISFIHLPGLLGGLVRKKRNSWGVVFDSKTKQPLDPVVLTLKDESGKELAQTISDLYGRYEFLVNPGTYFLSAQKTDYAFPSKNYGGIKADEVYDDLYLGDKINVLTAGKITYNLPMDVINADFNETAKATRYGVEGVSNFSKILIKIAGIAFNIGTIYSIIVAIAVPSILNFIILGLYLIIRGYKLYKTYMKGWGVILDNYNNPIASAVVRIINTKIPKFKIPPVVTDDTGRYVYLMDKGSYQVQVQTKDKIANSYVTKFTSEPIQIDGEYGSITKDIKI